MNTYTHVIWDWNGTLLNDAWLCVEILNTMLEPRELPSITQERYRERFDFPIREFYQRLGFDFGTDPFEQVATEFIEKYEERRFEAQLHEGVVASLQRVQENAIPQAILSAYSQTTLESIVAHWNLSDTFTHCMGLDDHYAASKLDLGRALVAQLAVDPAGIVLIGDTRHDAEVAEACGVDCVLVNGGHQSMERLRATGRPVYSSLSDCMDALL